MGHPPTPEAERLSSGRPPGHDQFLDPIEGLVFQDDPQGGLGHREVQAVQEVHAVALEYWMGPHPHPHVEVARRATTGTHGAPPGQP